MRVSQSGNKPVQNNEVSGSRQATRAQGTANSKKSGKAGASATPRNTGGAHAEISSRGKEMAQAKEVAGAAPDVREEKIAELKRRIADGRYRVDPDAIADRMVNDHLAMAGMG